MTMMAPARMNAHAIRHGVHRNLKSIIIKQRTEPDMDADLFAESI
jgi:hypothetical protein